MSQRSNNIRSCCAFGCTSKSYRLLVNGERVQYFPFPVEDEDLCKRWAQTLKVPPNPNYSKLYVCSKHFLSSDFKCEKIGKKVLRRGVVPDPSNLYPNPVKKPNQYKPKPRYSDDEEWEASSSEDTDEADESNSQIKENTSENDPLVMSNMPIIGKKVAVQVGQILRAGVCPYPWECTTFENWLMERTQAHEEESKKLEKIIADGENYVERLNSLTREQISILTHLLIKKYRGGKNMTQHLMNKD